MALMVGAMTIHNIQPGPQVMPSHPELFWGLIVSMWIGNLMLVILNLPLVGLWIKLLKVPYRVLFPAILVFCTIGVYSLNYNAFDIFVTAVVRPDRISVGQAEVRRRAAAAGPGPGPMMEENFRRALLLSRGDFMTFVSRPLSASLLGAAVALVIIVVLPSMREKAPRKRSSRKPGRPAPLRHTLQRQALRAFPIEGFRAFRGLVVEAGVAGQLGRASPRPSSRSPAPGLPIAGEAG